MLLRTTLSKIMFPKIYIHLTEKLNEAEEEIARIIILTILHTSRQHCHCQLVVHGQDSLRRGNTVHDNELAIKQSFILKTLQVNIVSLKCILPGLISDFD